MDIDGKRWRIGLVGYGEVGRILAEDLRQAGLDVAAYDVKLAIPQSGAQPAAGADLPLREHAAKHRVVLADSHATLAGAADLVISAVTASQALSVAAACAPSLRPGTWVLDLNSCSPGTKQRAAALVDAAGGRFVEGAVMTSVPPYRIRVPLLLGGPHAAPLQPQINELGFAAKVASDQLGVASATKMCRSVIIKGMESMFFESLITARAYGVEEQVLASLGETFPGIDWDRQASYFFQRAIQHGRRRAEEMVEAAATVRELGLDAWSAAGTARRQAWIADLADDGLFGERRAARPEETWRSPADRILQNLPRNLGTAAPHDDRKKAST
jgi:3-hydroxyisobutyrate dehydrogenase-like beta-hydroxyacid dehydrogenase